MCVCVRVCVCVCVCACVCVRVCVCVCVQARFLAQLIMVGVQTVTRAFTQTLRQEYQGEGVRGL